MLCKSESSPWIASLLVNEATVQERSAVLQARPYQRCESRLGRANGFKPKTLATRLGPSKFAIPPVRDGVAFYPSALEEGSRSEKAILLALAEMYVHGVSARKASKIVAELCGHSVSSNQVSNCAAKLDAELQSWRERPLGARYEKVRQVGQLLDRAVRSAIGVGPDGNGSVLGVSVALSGAEVHWRSFLASLQTRGLHGIQLIISDAQQGLSAARAAVFPSVPRQRCQFHLQQNAQAYIPRVDLRATVASAIRSLFNSPDLASAQEHLQHLVLAYAKSAPRLSKWMEKNIPQGFTVFSFPPAHQRRLRTSNAIERVNLKLKRRTRGAALFPNEAPLLRRISALFAEINEEWSTGKIYLNMNPSNPTLM